MKTNALDSIDITENESLSDKVSAIKHMVRSLELRLSGHEWDAKGDKFIYTGDVLAGKTVISKATGLLQPFCEEANLITIKQEKTFHRQKWELNTTFNRTLLAEMGSVAKNYSVIMKMFKNTVQNIGDIILGSKDFMNNMLGNGRDPLDNGGDKY